MKPTRRSVFSLAAVAGAASVVALTVTAACSSAPSISTGIVGDDDSDASPDTTGMSPIPLGDAAADGSTIGQMTDGAAADGSSANDSGTGTGGGSGTDASDGATDAAPAPSVCDPATTWGTGVLLAASTTADDRFGAITPDELTIAWTTPIGNDAGAGGTVMWGDRTAVTGTFTVQTLAMTGLAYDAVALGSDGLLMIVVRSDRRGFIALSRATRVDVFANPSETTFTEVNPDLLEADSDLVADPLVASGSDQLFYSSYSGTDPDSVQGAGRGDVTQRWLPQYFAPETELQTMSGKLRRPTGVSTDLRTLFYWDEVTSTERIAYRPTASAAFTMFAAVGGQMYAQPNASCRRIYYSQKNGASLDLYAADAL